MVGRLTRMGGSAWTIIVLLSTLLLGGGVVATVAFVRVYRTATARIEGTGRGPAVPLDRWLQAAQRGDYATARTLTNDPDFVFGVWQDRTEKALQAGHLQSYTIATAEPRGTTTAYQIQWTGGDTPHCQLLLVDADGKVSAPYPYQPGTCRAQGTAP